MKKPTSCGQFLSPDDVVKAKTYLDWLLDSGIISYIEYQTMNMQVKLASEVGNDTEQTN